MINSNYGIIMIHLRKLGLAVLLLHLISCKISLAVLDNDCSGHGHFDEQSGVCICDDPFPVSAGSKGWVGETCEIPVFHGNDDEGADMTVDCQNSDSCNELKEDEWSCFAIPGNAKEDNDEKSWNHLAFFLNRTKGDGDADLYGYSKNATNPPNFAQATGFDWQDTQTIRSSAVVHTLARSDYPEDYLNQGYYLCVHNYPGTGSLEFSLKATKEVCRVSFSRYDGGAPLVCSSPRDASEEDKRYTECKPTTGDCICKPPYAKPVENVYPGLGFESCSAPVTMISKDDASDSKAYESNDEYVAPQEWRFWGFNTSAEDYEVIATVAEKQGRRGGGGGGGRVAPFARFGVPPGASPGQFDERTRSPPSSSSSSSFGQHEHRIVLDSTVPGTRSGLWFIGVFGLSSGGRFDLSLQKFSCPGNCSSNGVCDRESHKCTCEENYGGADCSNYIKEIPYNSTVEKNTSPIFEYEYFNMPEITETMLSGNVDVRITAFASSNLWNEHIAALPEILLSLDPGSPGAFPSADNFTQRMVLNLNKQHSLTLCSSQFVQGPWKVALHNPLSNIALNYTLTVEKIGRCLNDCSGKGECSDDGVCQCEDDWAGGDCSVEKSGGGGTGGTTVHHHRFRSFISSLFLMAIGAAATFGYVSYRGIPRWLPMNMNGYSGSGLGLYQELHEHEGI
ncbi:hypothetical protein Ndes2526B_g06472 [Nannochloris sp. 'desiccata']